MLYFYRANTPTAQEVVHKLLILLLITLGNCLIILDHEPSISIQRQRNCLPGNP